MRAEAVDKLADVEDSRGWINIDDLSAQLGLTQAHGRRLAEYMRDLDWARLTFANGAHMILTPKGHEEIAKMRRPKWRRWMDSHPITMNVFWMTVTAIVAGIVYTIITYYMLKPS